MRLRELRISQHLSQLEVANKIGISQKTYSNYENGITEPNIATLKKFANFYNISIDGLVGNSYNFLDLKSLNKNQSEIINDIVYNLSVEDISKVYGFIKGLKN